jgi:hypothetical protein
METITVRVGIVPGRMQEIMLDGDRTAKTAFDSADIFAEDHEIRLNGLPADMDAELKDGDLLFLVKPIQGNKK